MISIKLVKEWIKLDQEDDDPILVELLNSASAICADVLRLDTVEELEPTPLNKMALLYTMAYLAEHREDADHNYLKTNLRALLESDRKAAF